MQVLDIEQPICNYNPVEISNNVLTLITTLVTRTSKYVALNLYMSRTQTGDHKMGTDSDPLNTFVRLCIAYEL